MLPLGLVAAFAAVLAGTAPALAQAVDAPVSLAPPAQLSPSDSQVQPDKEKDPRAKKGDATPAQPGGAMPAAGPGPRAAIGGDGVQVDTLGTIDPDTAGILSQDRGGFGAAMWKGMSRSLVDALLPRLPVNTASAVMRNLMRRLLLSTAAVPEGKGETGKLIALRVRMLAAMGDQKGVNDLLGATPRREEIAELLRLEANARLLANDYTRACALAASQIGKHQDAFWQKAFIFCQALAGEHAKAALGLALLRETGEKDTVFFDLVDALSGGTAATIVNLPDPTPLHLAMARVAKTQLPADVSSSNNPAILRTIATSPNAPVELRLDAGERAESAGALPLDALRQLYTGVTFTEEDLANPLSKAEAESGPLSRALLYRTALVQTVPAARAEAAARALALSRKGGRYASTVRVFLPVLKQIPPSADLLWFAPEAIRAFLVTGEAGPLRAWFSLMRASALFNKEAEITLSSLLPIARIAGADETENWDAAVLKAWWEGNADREKARQQAALLYSLLDVLGDPVPETSWDALITGPQRVTAAMPQPALWHRLRAAGAQGRIGETVLLTLLALGEGGPAEASPTVLRHVLESLKSVGLIAETRDMALEAALAAGL